MYKRSVSNYVERFCHFSNKIERYLITVLIICLILLILAQFLLTFEGIRYLLIETIRYEGISQTKL